MNFIKRGVGGNSRHHAVLRAGLDEGRGARGRPTGTSSRTGAAARALRRLRRATPRSSRSATRPCGTTWSGTSSRVSSTASGSGGTRGIHRPIQRGPRRAQGGRSGNRVGGPYLDLAATRRFVPQLLTGGRLGRVRPTALESFGALEGAPDGADFVVVDGHATTVPGRRPGEFAALEKFAEVGAWIRTAGDRSPSGGRSGTSSGGPTVAGTRGCPARRGHDPTGQRRRRRHPPLEPSPGRGDCPTCLWTDTWRVDEASRCRFSPSPPAFRPLFLPSVERRKVQVADGLLALASDRARVIVNTTDKRISASVDGRRIELSAYETQWVTASRRLEPGPARPRSWSG